MFRYPSVLVLFACAACHGKGAEDPSSPASAAPSTSSAAPVSTAAAPVPSLPPELEHALPSNDKLKVVLNAKGVQIYSCSPKPDEPSAFEWKLKAPEADLFDDHGQKVASHFAGPTWQAMDGSKVVGTVASKLDSPDPHAIPWLLLSATPAAETGLFGDVVNVARVDTNGGKAPKEGCDSSHVANEIRVPYSAKYRFYSPPTR
jgi:hypothetical protein